MIYVAYKFRNAHQPMQTSLPAGGGKPHRQTGWDAWPDWMRHWQYLIMFYGVVH